MNLQEAVRRRLTVASDYFDASNELGKSVSYYSESQTLLTVIAFEVLLKTIRLVCATKAHGESHDYCHIWNELPKSIRSTLIADAAERAPGQRNYSDIDKLLNDWSKAFRQYRYSYEINESRTNSEIEIASENWVEPDFEFHPMELSSLTETMISWLEAFISE